jgi:predicted ATPase with chaperone activity
MADASQSWIQAYQAAVEETDSEKLHERVMAAETAIYLRWQELASSPDGHVEHKSIERACDGLLQIKTERLGWPALDDLK